MVVVRLESGRHIGRGEAAGVSHFNEDAKRMLAQIEVEREQIEAGADRETLQRLLPAGGARNAFDCAMWSLEATRAGVPV